MATLEMRALIRRKRDGLAHTPTELSALAAAAVAGDIPDYQLSAWLMAVCFQHLTANETIALTHAFAASGETLSWADIDRPVADKHSTGGVGDKASLVLLPLLAAAGLAVPKMSGRGLGHTGGTLDKLASIPGFNTNLDQQGMRRVLEEAGCCIAGQSPALVPADKLFYALRDATETVDELGLVTASVMSKKLACGAPHIVIDVKCGSGAFFATPAEARAFAALAQRIATDAGRKLTCVITAMDQPLGRAVGNALEVQEVAGLLSGRRASPELRELCLALGAEALLLTEQSTEVEEGRQRLADLLDSGQAWQAFTRWVAAQGGDWPAFEEQADRAGEGYTQVAVRAPREGMVARLDAGAIGELAVELGAGRRAKDDRLDPWVGVECLAKVGMQVETGGELARLWLRPGDEGRAEELAGLLLAAVDVGSEREPFVQQLVLDTIRG